VDKILESVSVLLVDDGKLLKDRMAKAHINEEEILTFARQAHGLEHEVKVRRAREGRRHHDRPPGLAPTRCSPATHVEEAA
jgi:hypothetical protein